tara:strand:+ start:316 stop:480 length:165 start_codon:yes stop_codon:yes gene_type:complete
MIDGGPLGYRSAADFGYTNSGKAWLIARPNWLRRSTLMKRAIVELDDLDGRKIL